MLIIQNVTGHIKSIDRCTYFTVGLLDKSNHSPWAYIDKTPGIQGLKDLFGI